MAAELGSAEFVLRADAAQLIRAMDESSNKVKATTAKIAQDLGVSEQSVTKTANKIAAEQDRVAKANAASATSFINLTKSAIGFGVAAAGVATGAALVHQVMTSVAKSTQAAQQAQFALNAVYREATPIITEFANALAKNAGRGNTEAQAALATTRILTTQYGYTAEQIKVITQRSADLAAVQGSDLIETTRDIVAALRLEGDVAEKYGLALQQDAIQASLMTKAERERYQGLDPLTRSQITYTKFLQQSEYAQGQAGKRAGELAGANDRLKGNVDNLSVSVGKVFAPTVGVAAGKLADMTEQATKMVDAVGKMPEQQDEAEKSLSVLTLAILRSAGAAGAATAAFIELQRAQQGVAGVIQVGPDAGLPGAGPGPTAAQAAAALEGRNAVKRAQADERDRQTAIAEVRREVRAAEAEEGVRAAEEEHDREVKRIDAQRILLEVEREQKLQAVEAKTEAALAGIEAESRAAEKASAAAIAHLHAEQETAERAAKQRHDDVVAGLDAEQRATEDVTQETIRNQEIARDAAKDASEAKRDQAIADLDTEKRARDAARTEEDRAAEDSATAAKRREDDRHEAAVDGFADEVEAANDAKDAQLRNLDQVAEKAQDRHEQRLRHLSDEAESERDRHDERVREIEDEGRRAEDEHEHAVRAIEDQGKAASDQHERTVRRLEDEADAARDARDLTTRTAEDEQRAAEDIHEQRMAEIEDEGRAAQDEHEQSARAIADEGRLASDKHYQLLREIGDEGDAAEDVHDREMRALAERADAEDDHHRRVLSDLDDERKTRQDAVDEQIAALDAVDRAAQQAATAARLSGAVDAAKRGVQKAESTGNLSEIEAANRELAEAQQAILDNQTKNQRDATREQLENQKAAIADEIDARKDAETERSRILKAELDDEKQAANDRLKLIKDGLEARKRVADDELHLVRDSLDARKRAADDAYDLIQDELRARKDAADQTYRLVQDDVEDRKLAADDALKLVTDRLATEKRAEDDAYDQGVDRRDRERQELDDAFEASQRRRSDNKRELDDQLKDALDRIEHEQQSEDDAYKKTKDRLDKRKQAIGDANKDELDKIAARKASEDDAHDNAVRQAQDQATQEKRAVADRRTAEDLADKDKRAEIQTAFENEARDRKARYDDEATGEIPALRRALEAAQDHFRQRKEAADTQYGAEQQQIKDLYTHSETGLIPLAQKAAQEVATKYRDMASEVTASAKAQKAEIDNQYTNTSKTGLLDYLERARADAQDKLDQQKQYWQDWAEDIGGPQGQIQKVIGRFDALIKKIQEAGGTVTVGGRIEDRRGDDEGRHEGGRGGGSAGGVPSPYRVTFPFDAPYNGPYEGGAAWPGGPPRHRGIDLALPGPDNGRGTTFGAFQPGTVISQPEESAGGKGLIIRTDDGLYNYYGHLDDRLVDNGQHVEAGQPVGVLGRTGLEGGIQTHLHYEVRRSPGGDPVGSTIDPVPYMRGGTVGAPTTAGSRVFEFDLFGRHFVFRLPGGAQGMELIRAIEELGKDIGGREFGRAAAAIALSEGADGDLSRPGSGGARGPYQFDPGGELQNYARYLRTSVEEAGEQAGEFPLKAAAWALKGYLGDALNEGLDQGQRGADLAEWGSYYGQRPEGENWRRAGDAYRSLYGYANGGPIDRPTLLLDERSGRPYARAGEDGPEWVAPIAAGGQQRPLESAQINVMLGNQTLETISVTGIKLAVRRGLTLRDLGFS